MATLRELAQANIVEASDGICWFAIWKTGRAWNMESFYVDFDEKTRLFRIDEDDQERCREILKEDYNAVFVNGYYDNLGPLEDMTVSSLASGIKFQYEVGTRLNDCVA